MDEHLYFGKTTFQEYIERVLSALQLTVRAVQACDGDTPEASAFREGYNAALEAVAAAFGLPASVQSFSSWFPKRSGKGFTEASKQGSQAKETAQIFLCYGREDEEKVDRLYQRLSDEGFKPWMDTKNILPGEKRKSSIQKAVQSSDFVLVCLSTNSVSKSGSLHSEVRQALDIWQEKLEDDIYLIPVRLEDCKMPDNLQDLQWVDLFEGDGWIRLVKAIQVGMKRRAKVPADEKLFLGNEGQKVI